MYYLSSRFSHAVHWRELQSFSLCEPVGVSLTSCSGEYTGLLELASLVTDYYHVCYRASGLLYERPRQNESLIYRFRPRISPRHFDFRYRFRYHFLNHHISHHPM